MKQKLRTTFLTLLFIMTGYLCLSYFLLDGRLTYWTSFSAGTIEDSKKKNIFVTDELNVRYEGDSLKNKAELFTIWTNKRYEIKYFGILFYWTFEDPSWRYLHIEPNSEWIENKWFRRSLTTSHYYQNHSFSGGYESCCDRISCFVGDTVTVQFHKAWERESILGSIKVVIK